MITVTQRLFSKCFLEPNSYLVTSNIKGPLVGDLFWLYHRLLYATEVNSLLATGHEQQKKKDK